MDIKENKTITDLTKDSVSILTKKYIIVDEQELQVGENHRCAYVNSIVGRKELENEPKDVMESVLVIWGSEPTVVEKEE